MVSFRPFPPPDTFAAMTPIHPLHRTHPIRRVAGRDRSSALHSLVSAVLLLATALTLGLPSGLVAQLQAPQAGSAELGLLLRQMDGERRVLMIAAHPDDEDTSLLTVLARGHGARTAYLSLSRGEGGQNLIGPELEEGLGIIRTGELLSARSLDGAEQYFARAFDFGFSREAGETFEHWPREELLRDVVEVVRTVRPHVIVSIFTGTARDGHGQHQAAGIVSAEAFEAAADPSRFPEQLAAGLEAWAPRKLYRSTRFRTEATTLEVPTGTLDPLLGRSHFQVAMASRSRHRSQDMGAAETPGPRSTGLELVAGTGERGEPESHLFAGIDTTLVGLVKAASLAEESAVVPAVEGYRAGVHRASAELNAADPGRVLPHLLEAGEALDAALERVRAADAGASSAPTSELLVVLEARRAMLSEALLLAAGVVIELRVDRARATPGETVGVELLVWNAGETDWDLTAVTPQLPERWRFTDAGSSAETEPAPAEERLPAGALLRRSLQVQVPADAEPSRLYFLAEERDGSFYRWPDDPELRGRPGNPPLIEARVELAPVRVDPDSGEGPVSVTRPAAHVDVDKAMGEFRVPFMVVPALSVSVDPSRMAWPVDQSDPREVTLRLSHLGGAALEGELRLDAPEGWRVEPESQPFRLESAAEGGFGFRIHPPSDAAGSVRLAAVAHTSGPDGRPLEIREGLTLIDYPHLDPVPFYELAELRITHAPVRVAEGLRVGYLMGPGDDGMRALRDLGVEVELLDRERWRSADLDSFDAVVLGVRAYETREDLMASNERLLDYARGGGTVIVQYNKYEYPDGEFAPYPLAMRRPHDRVTDPDAPVTLLDPEHPLLSSPNRITAADFDGWVQERGLYFLSEWDERFTPLLEMSDPGLDPNRGSLVVARVGSGAYVYTGLALFRQLPQGVPGAFRLLANLVSLSGADLADRVDQEEGR